jgi:hypothetical protein
MYVLFPRIIKSLTYFRGNLGRAGYGASLDGMWVRTQSAKLNKNRSVYFWKSALHV